ncbi:PorP/SprF family type IX secretion system membrane protein, partial [Aquimarina sp. M1]
MIKKVLSISTFIFCLHFVSGQDGSSNTSGILPSDIPLHNSLKYNRFLFNPTFSLVRENKNSLNIYNRNPRASFSDNSQTYFLSYSARFEEKTGIGVGLFQQNVGIFRFFGATANYAYNLELDRDMNFTFGVNLSYSQSALKSNLDEAQVNDDVINNYENSSVFLLRPGVNFNYGNFDVGVSVGNLVTYNLTASELLTDNFEYSGHVMYTTELDWRRVENELRGMVYASKPGEQDLRYGGNVLFEIPKYGWAQLGYNSFYGGSIGIGANITKMVSIGYTVEPGIGGNANIAEFGATHEFGLAFNFAKEERRKRRNFSSKSSLQRDSEIRRLKKEILDQNKLIRELQNSRGDSLTEAQRSMNKLERSIQEAKEEEARKARQLALQREEEVKLLNKQREELAAQKKLELEMSEQKAEEERLAAEKRLALEMQEQKNAEEAAGTQAEEARIAAEEAAREAEAERQEAAAEAEAEEKRQAEEAIRLAEAEAETERQQIAAAEEAKEQAEAAREEEERLAAQKKLELEIAQQKEEEERLAAQKKLELEMAEQRRIEESQKTLEREVAVQKDEEAEAARLAEEERLRQEAEAARLAEEAEAARLAEEERLRQEAEAARLAEEAEAARLAEEERLRQEAEAARLAEEAEAARLAEEERLRQEA